MIQDDSTGIRWLQKERPRNVLAHWTKEMAGTLSETAIGAWDSARLHMTGNAGSALSSVDESHA